MIQNTRCCLRQHSPLHEAAKPRRAADEPLRGVDPLQEVTGKALDDGLHVGGTAPDELHHLQYHTGGSVLVWLVATQPSVGLEWSAEPGDPDKVIAGKGGAQVTF